MTTHTNQEALLDELLAGCADPKDILGENGLIRQLQKRLVEKALEAELTDHLGHDLHAAKKGTNTRNGKSAKHITTASGEVDSAVPRDREGSFEPQIVKKRQRRLEGFDDKVLAFYSCGLSTQ